MKTVSGAGLLAVCVEVQARAGWLRRCVRRPYGSADRVRRVWRCVLSEHGRLKGAAMLQCGLRV